MFSTNYKCFSYTYELYNLIFWGCGVAIPTHLIVIGTSAGGMPALTRLVEQLPDTLTAAVLVVQHLSPDSTGAPLVARLNSHTGLQC